jgi:DNA-binding transcriptional LysR family regulator
MRYDLHSLQLLASVVETRSFARTAALVHLTPSAVSKRIAELEAQLGVRLVVRSPQGVEPTAEGRVVASCAADLLDRVSAMSERLAEAARGDLGLVTVASNITALLSGLAGDLMAFRTAHPGVSIRIREGISTEVVEEVEAGRADVGVGSDLVATRGLTAIPWRETRLVVAVAEGHPLAGRSSVAFEETRAYRHVGRLPGSALSLMPGVAQVAEEGVEAEVRSFDAVIELVRAGAGIGVLPGASLDRRPAAGVLGIPLSDGWARFRLVLVHDANRPDRAAALRLLNWLRRRPSDAGGAGRRSEGP